MTNGGKKALTSEQQSGIIPTFKDAFGKFGLKVRWEARHVKHGKIELAANLQVVNGVITQCDTIRLEPFERFRADNTD